MPLHVRVELPDRPGALASIARTVAAAGADIRSVTVLHVEHGRAVDELLLDWPAPRDTTVLEDALSRCSGVRVLGLRRVGTVAETHDVDVVLQLLANPRRAHTTLVDALPGLLLADWAALVRRTGPAPTPSYASVGAPGVLPPIDGAPRAQQRQVGELSLLVVPGGAHLFVVGRTGALGFLPAEIDRAAAHVRVVERIAGGYEAAEAGRSRSAVSAGTCPANAPPAQSSRLATSTT